MRSPRLRDGSVEYDPETGYEMGCAIEVPDGQVFRSRRWSGRRIKNWPRYDVRDPLDLGEAPPDETQAEFPVADETEDGDARLEEFSAEPGWLLRDAVLASEQMDKWAAIWRRR